MNKIVSILLLLLVTFSVKAQYPLTQKLGASNTKVEVPPPGAVSGNIIMGSFADTTTANLTPLDFYNGAIIRVGDLLYMRSNGRWVLQTSSAVFDSSTRVISGSVIWVNGFNFSNTLITYQIRGRYFSTPSGNFSITGSDPDFDRFTIIVADTNGILSAIDGTAAEVATIPIPDPSSQVLVATYFIPAGSMQPSGLGTVVVYKENIIPPEWTGVTNISGGIFNSTTTPYQGLYNTYLPTWSNTEYVAWGNGEDNLKSDYSYISFYIKLTTAFTASDYIIVALQNAQGWIGYYLIHSGQAGFNGALLGQWQLVALPISSLNPSVVSNTFDHVLLQFYGGGGGVVQIDNVILQEGGNNQSGQGVITFNTFNGHVTTTTQWSTDSTWLYYLTNGVKSDSSYHPKDTLTAGTGIDIATIGRNHTISATGVDYWEAIGATGIVNTNTGNVGIGTDGFLEPLEKLQVFNLYPNPAMIQVGNQAEYLKVGTIGDYTGLWYNTPTPTAGNYIFQGGPDRTFFNANSVGGEGYLSFRINNVAKMRVQENGTVGINNTTPDASAYLDIGGIDKGLLIPRVTTTEMNAIPTPATGLLVWNTTELKLYEYTGAVWQPVGGSGGGGSWQDAIDVSLGLGDNPIANFHGNNMRMDSADNFRIKSVIDDIEYSVGSDEDVNMTVLNTVLSSQAKINIYAVDSTSTVANTDVYSTYYDGLYNQQFRVTPKEIIFSGSQQNNTTTLPKVRFENIEELLTTPSYIAAFDGDTIKKYDIANLVNIYNSDGTLTGNRTVTGGGNSLTFTTTSGGNTNYFYHQPTTSGHFITTASGTSGIEMASGIVDITATDGVGANDVQITASQTTFMGAPVLVAGGAGSITPSAVFEVQSTTHGVLMPRMTATQGSAIGSPADGLIIYVTSTNGTFTSVGFWGRENSVWIKL